LSYCICCKYTNYIDLYALSVCLRWTIPTTPPFIHPQTQAKPYTHVRYTSNEILLLFLARYVWNTSLGMKNTLQYSKYHLLFHKTAFSQHTSNNTPPHRYHSWCVWFQHCLLFIATMSPYCAHSIALTSSFCFIAANDSSGHVWE
jgi:hypothetical protein